MRYTKPGHNPVETSSRTEGAALKARGYVEDSAPKRSSRTAAPKRTERSATTATTTEVENAATDK